MAANMFGSENPLWMFLEPIASFSMTLYHLISDKNDIFIWYLFDIYRYPKHSCEIQCTFKKKSMHTFSFSAAIKV